MRCKNCDGKYYTGKENTPLGRGYSAAVEKVGTKMRGRDGKTYVVKKYSNGKRWVHVSSQGSPKPKGRKTAPKGLFSVTHGHVTIYARNDTFKKNIKYFTYKDKYLGLIIEGKITGMEKLKNHEEIVKRIRETVQPDKMTLNGKPIGFSDLFTNYRLIRSAFRNLHEYWINLGNFRRDKTVHGYVAEVLMYFFNFGGTKDEIKTGFSEYSVVNPFSPDLEQGNDIFGASSDYPPVMSPDVSEIDDNEYL